MRDPEHIADDLWTAMRVATVKCQNALDIYRAAISDHGQRASYEKVFNQTVIDSVADVNTVLEVASDRAQDLGVGTKLVWHVQPWAAVWADEATTREARVLRLTEYTHREIADDRFATPFSMASYHFNSRDGAYAMVTVDYVQWLFTHAGRASYENMEKHFRALYKQRLRERENA